MQSTNKNYIIGIVLIILIVLAIIIFAHHTSQYGTSYSATTTTPNETSTYTPSSNTTPNTSTTVNTSATTSTQNPLPPHTVSVSYTDSGFSPNSITINRGDTVTFVNQSASQMWVAGNPNAQYPQSYPGFNEGAQVSNGGKYSILFSQAGTYQYYNENHVGSVGVIIVQNPAQ